MANEVDNTEVDVIVPEKWRPQILLALYDNLRAAGRILNVTPEVSSEGDIVHVSIEPTVSVNDVTAATGAITNQALTPTEVQLTVDKWRHAAVDYVKKANAQAFKNWWQGLPAAMGRALAEDIETQILDLPSGLSSVGSITADVGEDEILAAIQGLLQNKLDPMARPGDFTFAFDAGQFKALKKLKAMSDAGFRGTGSGGFAAAGRLPDIYGIPAYLTNQVEASSTGKNNLLFHREWAAWAVQRNMDISMKDPSDRLSTVLIVDYLAGFKQIRSTHAYSILSK